jgi:hypothetical protein
MVGQSDDGGAGSSNKIDKIRSLNDSPLKGGLPVSIS